jgi:replicative DNA helicase
LLICQNLSTNAFDLDSDLRATIALVMDKLSKTATGKDGARHISEVLSILYDEIDEACKNPREIFGISTGYPDWDKVAGGLGCRHN